VPVLSWCALRRSTAHCPPTYSFRGRSMQFQKPACGPRLLQRPPSALASPKHLPSRPRSSAFALTPHVRLVNPSSLLPVEQSQSLASPWTPSHLLFRSCRRGRANPRCPSFDPCLGRSSWTFRCRLAPSRRRGDSVDQKKTIPIDIDDEQRLEAGPAPHCPPRARVLSLTERRQRRCRSPESRVVAAAVTILLLLK
jgi:hypothetical protein